MKPSPEAGVVLVDKPAGPSSFHTIAQVRRLFGVSKVGHAGTLDPFATGLLVVAYGRATRLLDLALGGDKTYLVTVTFGRSTDSGDPDGQTTRTMVCDPVAVFGHDHGRLKAAVDALVGVSSQRPPMHSALKVNGERLYARARRGDVVARPERPIEVKQAEVCRVDGVHVDLRLTVTRGTYVRTLAERLGDDLGVPAMASRLRRTHVGALSVDQAHDLDVWFTRFNAFGRDAQAFVRDRLAAGAILSPLVLAASVPCLAINQKEMMLLCAGRPLTLPLPEIQVDDGAQVRLCRDGDDVALVRVHRDGDGLRVGKRVLWVTSDGHF